MATDDDGRDTQGKFNSAGYGKPPVEHRFKKGVSGNPKGRPRKAPPSALDGLSLPPLGRILLEEAYRPVTIQENGKARTISLLRAVMRRTVHDAAKGDHRARSAVTSAVNAAERHQEEQDGKILEFVRNYKEQWNEEFRRCRYAGRPLPEPLPHPDDIVVDRTGRVIVNGPSDEADKLIWDRYHQARIGWMEEIEELRTLIAGEVCTPEILERDIEHARWMIVIVDKTFPDEKTRRMPGFDLHAWRLRPGQVRKMAKDQLEWSAGKLPHLPLTIPQVGRRRR